MNLRPFLCFAFCFCLHFNLSAQLNRIPFDRYEPFETEYMTGYRNDSFFIFSKVGFLECAGKGKPVQHVGDNLFIFTRNNRFGIIKSRISDGDTMLFPPVYKHIVTIQKNWLELVNTQGKKLWYQTELETINTSPPPEQEKYITAYGDSDDGTFAFNKVGGARLKFTKNPNLFYMADTLRTSARDVYFRGPFSNQYVIHKSGKFIGISTIEKGKINDILPCRYSTYLNLYNPDATHAKNLLLFQSDSGYLHAWVNTGKEVHTLVSDSIEIKNRNENSSQILYFQQKGNKVYIRHQSAWMKLTHIYTIHPKWDKTIWFFETRWCSILVGDTLPYNDLNPGPVLQSRDNYILCSLIPKNTTVAEKPQFILYENGKFSTPISNYWVKKDATGSDYLMYRLTSSPDSLRMKIYWYTDIVGNGEYDMLSSDMFMRKNANGFYDIIEMRFRKPVVVQSGLKAVPHGCFLHPRANKLNLMMGYYVHLPDSSFDLYNNHHMCLERGIKNLQYNSESGIFTGIDSAGKPFAAFAGMESEQNFIYLKPGETITHQSGYALLHLKGKNGYFSYINRMYIPPVYDAFSFQSNILVAQKNNNYYFYETGLE